MKILNLTLKKQWFDMINSGEKTEEYREIKPYWANRLMGTSTAFWKGYLGYSSNNKRCYGFKDQGSIDFMVAKCNGFKSFVGVLFRNGYSSDARQRSFKFESISIGEGRPEWGAEPGKKYFVIKFSPFI